MGFTEGLVIGLVSGITVTMLILIPLSMRAISTWKSTAFAWRQRAVDWQREAGRQQEARHDANVSGDRG